MRHIFLLLFVILSFLNVGWADDYQQWYLPEGAIARLGKGGIIGKIAFSPDSSMIAIPSMIGIWLYDAQTYKELALLTGDTSGNDKLKFSPDSETLASSVNQDILLWNVRTGQLRKTITGYSDLVHAVTFAPDGKTLITIE
ncbi:hypothetical protein F4225_14895, partial [Candidatus Poribacteria bacterium]|nr:hypothetical protein [Candidatus Poribacteria bacterium]